MESVTSGKACPALPRSLNQSGISATARTITLTSPSGLRSPAPCLALTASLRPRRVALCSASTAMATANPSVLLLGEKYDDLLVQQEESSRLQRRIRLLAMEIERVTWSISISLFQPDDSLALDEAKAQIEVIKDLYGRLSEIFREHNGANRYDYYWKAETRKVVSFLAFMHWLESGDLLAMDELQEKLGLLINSDGEEGSDAENNSNGEEDSDEPNGEEGSAELNNSNDEEVSDDETDNSNDEESSDDEEYYFSKFYVIEEDYNAGVCLMSNEMSRYAVKRVIAGDYDCFKEVLAFLEDLEKKMDDLTDDDAFFTLMDNVRDLRDIQDLVKQDLESTGDQGKQGQL